MRRVLITAPDTSSLPRRSVAGALRLAVLGGSGPGMPVLLAALEESQRCGRLGEVEVRLHGRNALRLERIRRFAELQMTVPMRIQVSTRLDEVLAGATHVLCMLRPGGMEGRAQDEALALHAGTPADEGLGVGGLACFLRGRALIAAVAERCSELAPQALFLQMTSPLGLNVAISHRVLGARVVGVCELPVVTSASVSRELAAHGLRGEIQRRCFGLNHQSWLYAFRDDAGSDVTQQVLDCVDTNRLLGIEPHVVRRHGAIPMSYMRLYFHTGRVLDAQRQQSTSRGEQLGEWSRRLDESYCAGIEPDARTILKLLQGRRMDWFREGVVPVIEASLSDEPRVIPLNLPAQGAAQGVDADAVVEMDCEISSSGIRPIPTPPLPPLPHALTQRLLDFEKAALGLVERPRVADVAAVLALHPLTPMENLSSIAGALAAVMPERPILN